MRGRCPICSKTFEIATLDDLPSFPFCSERCRLIDLARWADGTYAIPVENTGPASPSRGGGADEADDE